jgi:Protein of unknown function (DUF4058)
MPSPFPGMDPYLEAPEFWSEVHNRMIVAIADDLSAKLRPRYRVAIEYELPEEMRESYLEVREAATGRVVTIIELLSPKTKRQQVLASAIHFVEIDLLRRGKHFPLGQQQVAKQYYVLVARGDDLRSVKDQRRPNADLYPFTLREAMPSFALPLEGRDAEPVVVLQEIFNGVYDRAGFDLAINYRQPIRSLSGEDAVWVEGIVQS